MLLQDVFTMQNGTLAATGLRPRFLDRLQERGISVSPDVFAPVPGGRAA